MNAPATIPVSVRQADLADASEAARLDAFVADHPDGTLFHRPQWMQMVDRGCGQRGLVLIAERGGSLAGCLPLTAIRSALFGNALVSSGFAIGGGILADGDGVAARLGEEAWALARRSGYGSVELRGGPLPDGWIRQQGLYSGFSRALPGDGKTLLEAIPRRQRAEVRRALGSELVTSAGSDQRHADAHFRVYGESVRNLGTPVFPKRLFRAALDIFGAEADVVAVWKDGRPHAALLNFYFRGACMPFWGGGTEQARRSRANDLIYYDVMRRAIERGCRLADFGRSKVGTGPWTRKRIWGFEESPLVYGLRTAAGEAPREVNPLDPRYRLKIDAWQKLPLWIANRLGPMIARGLG